MMGDIILTFHCYGSR